VRVTMPIKGAQWCDRFSRFLLAPSYAFSCSCCFWLLLLSFAASAILPSMAHVKNTVRPTSIEARPEATDATSQEVTEELPSMVACTKGVVSSSSHEGSATDSSDSGDESQSDDSDDELIVSDSDYTKKAQHVDSSTPSI
jgi:hypothetical protein